MNNETIHLLKCPHCGKIFKIVHMQYDSFFCEHLVTDFGDKLEIKKQVIIEPIYKELEKGYIATQSFTSLIEEYVNCIHCKRPFYITDNNVLINCEPWIADKVFTIKGG